MSIDEKYGSCRTIRELNRVLANTLRNAKSKEEEDECNRAYAKHYKRVFILTMIKALE